jgi:hypothetical protein
VTETELERMVVRLVGEAAQYQKMMDDAVKTAKETASKVEELTKKIEGFGKGLAAFGKSALGWLGGLGAAGSLAAMFQAFEASEKRMNRLSAAIDASGHAVGPTLERYKAFAKQIADTTLATKGQVYELLQMAESFGMSGDAAEKSVKTAQAIAAAKGGEARAYLRVQQAMDDGNVQMLRYMLRMRGVKDESKILEQAHKMIASGQKILEKQTETAEFQFNQLKKTLGAVTVEIGGMVARAIVPAVKAFRSLVGAIMDAGPAAKTLVIASVALFATLALLPSVISLIVTVTGSAVTGFLALKAASVAFWTFMFANPALLAVVGLTLLAGVVVAVGKSFAASSESARKFQEGLDRIAESAKGFSAAFGRRSQRIVDTGEQIGATEGPEKQAEYLEAQYKRLEAERKKTEELVKRDESYLKRWDNIWRRKGEGYDIAKAQLDAHKKELDGVTEAAKKVGDAMSAIKDPEKDEKLIKAVSDSLVKMKEQIAVFGLTGHEMEIAKFKAKGFTDEFLKGLISVGNKLDGLNAYKKLLGEGKHVTEEFLSPQQKFAEHVDHLNQLLDVGAITWRTYALAVNKAADGVNKTGGALEKIQGLTSGSAEALGKISAYTERLFPSTGLRQIGGVTLPEKPTAITDVVPDIRTGAPAQLAPRERIERAAKKTPGELAIEKLLTEIRDALKEQRKGPKIDIKPGAGLT